jgi:hypothetical protein
VRLKVLKHRNEGTTGLRQTVFGMDTGKMKIFEIDQAEDVKAILKHPRRGTMTAEERVTAKAPQFALP